MKAPIHYLKKIHQYGLFTSLSIIKDRLNKRLFDTYWRTRARYRKASHSWQSIQKKHQTNLSFELFLQDVTIKEPHYIKEALRQAYEHHEQIISQANLYQQHCFSLLGSRPACFLEMPWHIDFRLQQQASSSDYKFDPQAYYKDIKITPGSGDSLSKDIKIPWEISRLQHFFVLGQAYTITNAIAFAQAFVHQFIDWHSNNHFLLGPAWMCPMDVGLRAVNLVLAFHLFKQCQDMPVDFWQTYVCSLYDHLFYLEHNWEVYDYKTSNHYLSDLIGYYYLCSFFSSIPGIPEKLRWCHQELLREWDKQVFDEGTDYEGSTCYHRLITELFHHMILVSADEQLPVAKQYLDKFNRMIDFLQWCTPQSGQLIQIGDNDSGTIVNGLLPQLMQNDIKQLGIKHYKEFGLSIIKNEQWHISLRHHAYQSKQPSGHFHNDWASLTLSYKGIPIFVDPGSYIYTPSAIWRNYFRSVAVHNTVYVEHEEPVSFDERLFALEIPEAITDEHSNEQENTISTRHNLYKRFGLCLQRNVQCNEHSQVIIEDSWNIANPEAIKDNYVIWNFTLGYQIKAHKTENGIALYSDNKPILSIESELYFEIVPGWLSMNYGSKIATQRLRAKVFLCDTHQMRALIKAV